jgi:RNA polymerase sigma-70 factor (ECF subfamily)
MRKEKQQELLKLIAENERIVYKVSNTYCSDKNDRQDLAQEIIYNLLKSYHSFDDQYKFSTWMYRVALNVAISFYRKNKTGNVISHKADFEDRPDEINSELENNLNILETFIDQLKELDKALMILYLESKSYHEISEILGISETNVATKISRIKNILKQKFSNLNQ